ncbi:MAG TPA: ABC transporter permease [Rhodoglobus sp.]|nr:ABC transporter permease [Rhodoglobus sp.]
MNTFRLREHGSSILVAALASAFGVVLLQITGNLAAAIRSDDVTGSSDTVQLMLQVLAIVFIVIAMYVSAVVTANTFATIIAGRTREIALLRLIGSTAASRRRAVAAEGLVVGILGSIAGLLVGTAVSFTVTTIAVARDLMPSIAYPYLEPVLLLPIAGTVLTTWLASWVGSRRVLTVSPMAATGAAQERDAEEAGHRRGRNGLALGLFIAGTVLLGMGVVAGLVTPAGVLIGLVGGVLSFTGVVLGAQLIMPPALRLVGRMFGHGAAGRLAAENAVRYPERASRTTIGLVIGVTLITMFAVAVETFSAMIRAAQAEQPEVYGGTEEMLVVVVSVFSVLIGFSALIAAVGMVNNLSLTVLQRTRELGLLRALGFSVRQLRGMIRAEAAQLTLAALLVGLVLGIGYGWAGAQSLLGATGGIVLPAVPLWLLVAIAVVAVGLTVVASAVPARRATRISPVTALAVD